MRTPNLEKFAHKCSMNSRDHVTVTAQEARGIATEYMHVLEHITKLQEQIIVLQEANNTVIKVDYDAGEFE